MYVYISCLVGRAIANRWKNKIKNVFSDLRSHPSHWLWFIIPAHSIRILTAQFIEWNIFVLLDLSFMLRGCAWCAEAYQRWWIFSLWVITEIISGNCILSLHLICWSNCNDWWHRGTIFHNIAWYIMLSNNLKVIT